MADETHVRPVPSVRSGASLVAPTAPHATPPEPPRDPRRRTRARPGPERFWDARRVRRAMLTCAALSVLLHYAIMPIALLPSERIEVKDQAGDLAIPVDIFEEAPEPAPKAAAPTITPPPPSAEQGRAGEGARGRPDAGLVAHRDAAAPRDASRARDVEVDAEESDAAIADARVDGEGDGGLDAAPFDAGATPLATDAGGGALADAMVAKNADGGVTGVGPHDPAALLGGAATGVQAGPQNVQVVLNMEAVRSNTVGARLGPLLAAMPQWRDFFAGTGVDPVRDGDWFMLFGPSLVNTERDVALVQFNVSDQRASKALEMIARRDVGGGTYDAGVPGVRAWRGRADRAARVFMIPRPHLAVVSPPDFATKAAAAFAHMGAKKLPGNEAVSARFRSPHGSVPAVPDGIRELRITVRPRADGGADVEAVGDCTDAAAAMDASAAMGRLVRRENSIMVQAITRGVLNSFAVTAEGSTVRGRLVVTQDQLEALYELGAAYLGVNVPPPPGGATNGPP